MRTRGPADRSTTKWGVAGLAVAALLIGPIPLLGECNTAPTAVGDAARTVTERILVDVLGNDTDPEGQALSVSVTGTTCPGTAAVEFDLVAFTPQSQLTRDCTIIYRITDEEGMSDTGVVTVTVEFEAGIFSDGFESGDTSKWGGSI